MSSASSSPSRRYDASTPFPGTATLLPVLAPCSSSSPVAPARRRRPIVVLGSQPLQWIGRHSYAIYLWHWPVLVLAEARFGPLSLPTRVVLVVASIGLAALSVRFVEDPARYSRGSAVRPTRGLTIGAALCSVAIAVGWASVATAPALGTERVAAAPVLATAAPDSAWHRRDRPAT